MSNIYLTKLAEMSEYKGVAEKLKNEFLKDVNIKEKQEHSQGSVPGTAFKGKETAKEESAEVAETAAKAGKKVGDEVGAALAKVAGFGTEQGNSPSMGSTLALGAGVIGASAYGRSVLNRARKSGSMGGGMMTTPSGSFARTPGSKGVSVGLGQGIKQTVATDVSTGISKVRRLGGLLRSKFPLKV